MEISFCSKPLSEISKEISTPSLRPIQFVCMVNILLGQSNRPLKSNNRSAYWVMRKNHCSKSLRVMVVPHRSQLPLITCSLASTVWQEGHHTTGAFAR